MAEEITTPTVDAETTESAPVEETEAPETPAVNEEDSAPSTDEAVEEGSAPAQSKAVKELITVRKRAQAAEAEAAYYKALAAAGSGQGLPPQAPHPAYDPQKPIVPTELPPAPKQEDFDSWEAFETAKEDYIVKKAGAEFMRHFNTNIQAYNQSQAERSFEQRIEQAAVQNPAIRQILTDNTLPITNTMAEVIKSSESSAQLLVYLNENRQDAARIATMAPFMAAKELGRIEAVLQNTPPPPKPKKISQAPEPIKTVNGAGSPVVDENNLPMEEWVARRNAAQFKKK